MKRTIILTLSLLAALLLLTACTTETPEVSQSFPIDGESAQPASASEAASVPEETPFIPETEPPIPTETPVAGADDLPGDDLISLDIASLVGALEGSDGMLPFILPDCPAAGEINEDIEGRFGYLIGEEFCYMSYECYKGLNGRILSVIITQRFDDDFTSRTPYNIDLASGTWISGEELLDILGISEEELTEAELSIMAVEFENAYGAAYGEEFYEAQLARTVAPENAELDRLWLGDLGALMFTARLYSMAGADYYEYPLAAGYSFP